MNSILAIFNKFCLKIGFFNGVWNRYDQIARIYKIVNEDYGIVIETYYKYSNYKNYPNKKAFRQLIPEIIELKKLISMFSVDWEIFSFQYRQMKKLYRKKQYYQAGKLINKKSIDIQGNLFSLYQLAKYVEKSFKKLYYSKGNLGLHYQNQDLQELYDTSQSFAFKFSQTKSAAINNLKPQIFAELSEHYKEKNFGQAARNFWDFISHTNFENGTYSPRDYSENNYIPYENYFVYWLKEQKELEQKWREQELSSVVTTFSLDSPYYFDYLKNKKWCNENNYSELFYQDGLWYAFPPGAAIPIEILYSKYKTIFEYQSNSAFINGFLFGVMGFFSLLVITLYTTKDRTILSLFNSCLIGTILFFYFLIVKNNCKLHFKRFNETNNFTIEMKKDFTILGFLSVWLFGLISLLFFSYL